jgi:hypothetical protein
VSDGTQRKLLDNSMKPREIRSSHNAEIHGVTS